MIASRCWIELWSSEGLTEAKASVSKMIHPCGFWQVAGMRQASPQGSLSVLSTWQLVLLRANDPRDIREEDTFFMIQPISHMCHSGTILVVTQVSTIWYGREYQDSVNSRRTTQAWIIGLSWRLATRSHIEFKSQEVVSSVSSKQAGIWVRNTGESSV